VPLPPLCTTTRHTNPPIRPLSPHRHSDEALFQDRYVIFFWKFRANTIFRRQSTVTELQGYIINSTRSFSCQERERDEHTHTYTYSCTSSCKKSKHTTDTHPRCANTWSFLWGVDVKWMTAARMINEHICKYIHNHVCTQYICRSILMHCGSIFMHGPLLCAYLYQYICTYQIYLSNIYLYLHTSVLTYTYA